MVDLVEVWLSCGEFGDVEQDVHHSDADEQPSQDVHSLRDQADTGTCQDSEEVV